MKKKVELPLAEPIYSTYHQQGASSAVFAKNPSVRNWYYSQVFILSCTRKFLNGYTTPQIDVVNSDFEGNPYLYKLWYSMKFLKGYTSRVIKNMLDEGYYVSFSGIDDYYVEGKSWYKEKHFFHNGCICGYNDEDKTYCIYAYDKNWIYQKFWTPQKGLENGRKAMFKQKKIGRIGAIKAKSEQAMFSSETALKTMSEYLNSSLEKYPENEDGSVFGIVVHDYITKYVGMLYEGSIPYDRMDSRIFRLIWEQKKVLLESIKCIENELSLPPDISKSYELIVSEANTMRLLYASHHMNRRDFVLPVIVKKLIFIKETEEKLLNALLLKARRENLQ